MMYLFLTIAICFLIIWVMLLSKELSDFKQHVFKFEQGQIDINKNFCETLSNILDCSHTEKE